MNLVIYTVVIINVHMPTSMHTQQGDDEDDEEGHPRDSLWVSSKLKTMILATNEQGQTPLHLAAQNGHDK